MQIGLTFLIPLLTVCW